MVFGQVVVGPHGYGKTTYCNDMSQFLNLIGRKVAIVNLDLANDSLPYPSADIQLASTYNTATDSIINQDTPEPTTTEKKKEKENKEKKEKKKKEEVLPADVDGSEELEHEVVKKEKKMKRKESTEL